MAKRTKKTASKKKSAKANGNGGNLGFEATLWQAADKMRGHMDASEYKHVALGRFCPRTWFKVGGAASLIVLVMKQWLLTV